MYDATYRRMVTAAVILITMAVSAAANEGKKWHYEAGVYSANLAAFVVDKRIAADSAWGLLSSSSVVLPNGDVQLITFWRVFDTSVRGKDAIYRCVDVLSTEQAGSVSAHCETPQL